MAVESTAGSSTIAAASSSTVSPETVGVLLLNLGGPETLDQVQPFLYNLFSDPEIITLPQWLEWAERTVEMVALRAHT